MSTEKSNDQQKGSPQDDPSKINKKRNVEMSDEELGRVSGGEGTEEEQVQT
jgi:hypothetical protein